MTYRILSFLIGLGAAIQINFGATAAISELLCVAILVSNPRLFTVKDKALKNILMLGVLWIVGITISDLVNNRPLMDTIRSAGAVFLLLVSIRVAFSVLCKNSDLILIYGLGLGFSYALQFKFFPSSVVQSLLEQGFPPAQLSEIYFAINFFPLAIWVSGFAWYLNYRITALLIMLGYAAVSLSYDRRSIFLVGMLSMFYLITILREKKSQYLVSNRSLFRKRIVQVIAVSFAIFSATQLYEHSASQGLLGEGARQKYELQANTAIFGLASGRLDFFQGLYGALERPLLGYGSYASDTTKIRERFLEALGLPELQTVAEGLPGHSHIIGAWLYAGALSVPFWIYVIKYLVVFVLRAPATDLKLIGYFIPVALYTLWNIAFSPFSNRIDLAFAISFTVILLRNSKKRREIERQIQELECDPR